MAHEAADFNADDGRAFDCAEEKGGLGANGGLRDACANLYYSPDGDEPNEEQGNLRPPTPSKASPQRLVIASAQQHQPEM